MVRGLSPMVHAWSQLLVAAAASSHPPGRGGEEEVSGSAVRAGSKPSGKALCSRRRTSTCAILARRTFLISVNTLFSSARSRYTPTRPCNLQCRAYNFSTSSDTERKKDPPALPANARANMANSLGVVRCRIQNAFHVRVLCFWRRGRSHSACHPTGACTRRRGSRQTMLVWGAESGRI